MSWGQWGDSARHQRYKQPAAKTRQRRNCPCGCKRRITHSGMANGVALFSGCELAVARWVKTGDYLPRPAWTTSGTGLQT